MRSFLYNQMKYYIDRNSHESAYMQLYRQLRTDITQGVYPYGTKLPSKRILAEETQVSVITIEHACEILCDEGYIRARERSGYYVAYRQADFVPIAQPENRVEVNGEYHVRDGEEFPFSVIARTMRNVISRYAERLMVRSPGFGCDELKRAICAYLARSKGMSISPQQVVIGSGAEYLYGLIVQFLGRDRLYAIEDPSYEKILSVYRANGAECELLKLGNDGILSSELQRSRASVLHITPYRSFPSGVTASASKRNEYIRWAQSRGGVIIEDDFDSEFTVSTKHEDTVFSLEPNESVIYVNTFSKTIAPSMRIGYMVLPESMTEEFIEKLSFYSCTVPVFEQYMLAQLISNGDFERHINRVRRKRRQGIK